MWVSCLKHEQIKQNCRCQLTTGRCLGIIALSSSAKLVFPVEQFNLGTYLESNLEAVSVTELLSGSTKDRAWAVSDDGVSLQKEVGIELPQAIPT